MLDPPTVQRVLVAGDTHGNTDWIGGLCRAAESYDCELIIQVGDFGLFPHNARALVAAVEEQATTFGVEVWFIDGNHDDHDALRNLEPTDGEHRLSPRVRYLPRGTRLELGGQRFGFCGGAHSIDWRARIPGFSWWESELVTEDDIEALGTEPLDVLITHDAPAGFRIPTTVTAPPDDELVTYNNRRLLAVAVERTKPSLVVHGHWHARTSNVIEHRDGGSCRVEGLDRDKAGRDSWAVLDLATLELGLPRRRAA